LLDVLEGELATDEFFPLPLRPGFLPLFLEAEFAEFPSR
jgi:hypothetical protein